MLNTTHFVFLAISFVISIALGIVLRVLYNSDSSGNSYLRIKNVIFLTIAFPIVAYREITKHKTDFIRDINKNDKLTDGQKRKLRKRLNSNIRVLSFVTFNSIRRFKPILDGHIEFLNEYKEKNNEELNLTLKVRIELKRNNIKKDFYKDKISGLFAN